MKDIEIAVFRHQLEVLSSALPRWRWSSFLVTSDTILRWHRRLVARKWTQPYRRVGRPPLGDQVVALILQLARENPRWGYRRIQGELKKLGVRVSATTIRTVLLGNGFRPAPRSTSVTWRAFQEPGTVGVTSAPRFPIRDRDSKFTRAFDDVFAADGIRTIRTPIHAPNANASAERWVRTVRQECLDCMLVWGRRHLERVLDEYVRHYNDERPHRSLALRPPRSIGVRAGPDAVTVAAHVRRRDRLGSLVHEYYQVAA